MSCIVLNGFGVTLYRINNLSMYLYLIKYNKKKQLVCVAQQQRIINKNI